MQNVGFKDIPEVEIYHIIDREHKKQQNPWKGHQKYISTK